jgi:hypothetical protein
MSSSKNLRKGTCSKRLREKYQEINGSKSLVPRKYMVPRKIIFVAHGKSCYFGCQTKT